MTVRRSGNGAGEPRHIDESIGLLAGEGSHQEVKGEKPKALAPYEVWDKEPSDEAGRDDFTYYDRPAIKEPVWIWSVPAYFYAGGTAGAAAVLAAASDALGNGELTGLVRRARWIAAAGALSGTVFLIYDLGRPERFLNMLRVFRITSPMSIGSWVLSAATPVYLGSALLDGAGGALGRVGRTAGYAGALLGLPLCTYTAVLLSNTAVPIWQGSRRTLPYLFASSAASGAASLLQLTDLNEDEQRAVRVFGAVAQAGELVAGAALDREASKVQRVAKPLKEGLAGALWRASKVFTAASLVLLVAPGKSRLKQTAAGALGTAGALSLRFAVFHAGKASSRDPRATFHQQRQGGGAAEVSESSAATSP